MKAKSMHIAQRVILSVLVIMLSGCALGGRVRNNQLQTPPQAEQNLSSSAPAAPTDLPVTDTTSAPNHDDPQADELLQLIDSLDAANQAADPLDDIP